MSITPIVGAGIELASEIFKWLNIKEKKKYSEKLIKFRTELDTELRKPVWEQNDGKIERLEDEIHVIQDLALTELRNLNSVQDSK
jgi:ribosomal protein S13